MPKRYRLTEYTLQDGTVVHGTKIYSARNALLVVTREGRYRRLDPSKVVRSESRNLSLMPTGLLADLSPADVADLMAYLRSF